MNFEANLHHVYTVRTDYKFTYLSQQFQKTLLWRGWLDKAHMLWKSWNIAE
jgi:hypothetical protein